jgi:hypothetical protein
MAIIIENESSCAMCNSLLNKARPYIITPPLIGNSLDALFKFSDCGLHIDCLENNNIKGKLLYHIKRYDTRLNKYLESLRINPESGKSIISLGLLTSDENEELFKYNYLELTKENVSHWSERDRFILVITEFINMGKWVSLTEFHYLKYLLNEINVN